VPYEDFSSRDFSLGDFDFGFCFSGWQDPTQKQHRPTSVPQRNNEFNFAKLERVN